MQGWLASLYISNEENGAEHRLLTNLFVLGKVYNIDSVHKIKVEITKQTESIVKSVIIEFRNYGILLFFK